MKSSPSSLRPLCRGLATITALVSIVGCGAPEIPPVDPAREPVLEAPEGAATSTAMSAIGDELGRLDPSSDGFESEVLSERARTALDRIGRRLSMIDTAGEFGIAVDDGFAGSQLRPPEPEVVFRDPTLEVLEGRLEADAHLGADGLDAALRALGSPFVGGELAAKFKIDRVTVTGEDSFSTGILYLGRGRGRSEVVQQNARWEARWKLDGNRAVLHRLAASDFREVRAPRSLYADVTRSAFPGDGDLDRLRRGIDSWWGRIDAGLGYSFYGDYALALGDVDNDGLEDVYLCQPGGVANQLFRHRPDGTLEDISAASGVDILNDTPTALFADFDNDGNQDLVVANLLYLMVMRGDGAGGFELAAEVLVDNAVSMSAADYDGDGALDLYVARYSSSRSTPSGAAIYDSDEGRPNVLLRNEGGLRFRDVTVESGIDHNNTKFSFASVWEDYDDDGDPDLYVANDFGRNNLYQNRGGRFVDVAGEAGAEDRAAGMGASWADFDRDGRMDLHVSNMFSSAGGRIVDKPEIARIAGGDDVVAPLQRFAKGNTLLRNRGDGTFEDVSDRAGVTMGRWSWGAEFVDVNGDGHQDLMVPNGFVTNHNSKDL